MLFAAGRVRGSSADRVLEDAATNFAHEVALIRYGGQIEAENALFVGNTAAYESLQRAEQFRYQVLGSGISALGEAGSAGLFGYTVSKYPSILGIG